jgi:hypothetical protein
MNTDVGRGGSDAATDELDVFHNTDAGRRYLIERRSAGRHRRRWPTSLFAWAT